ncbi:E3 ubiquitin-protein ligase RNF115-like isoform X1 [Dermacentor andersoni]|uniref:E3 ubiquitin-protein ligase RNF115-like isoform X1 n=1 Tax=Dermacentor andersoni TaxID=34620 RepID=UPI00215575A3|nr:E3 ubiquitin-protein ligase RNF115-like isoform X1 [Dermacentor andersoni]
MDRNMAEAAVETPAVRFFCHKCNQEINPVLPEYICPRCQSGFIEELAQGPPDHSIEDSDDDLDHAAQFRELWNSTIMDVLRRLDRGPGGMVEDNLSPDAPSSSASDSMVRRRSPGRAGRRPHPESQGRQPLEGIIHQIFANLTGTTGFISNQGLPVRLVNLHGNPGDYAWGRGGLDAVITQLLNQLDGTGPPPLAKDKIEQIPTVKIVQEQVDKLLQCTVCMEEFKTGEQVKRLPCQHHFHPDCIVPWLELHGTCPICRKLLNEEAGSESASAAGSSTSSGPSRAAGAGPLPRSQSDRHDAAMAALLRMHGAPRSARSSHLPPPAASASSSSSSTSSQPPTSRARRQSPANSTSSRRGSHPGGNQYSVYDFNDECD